MDEMKLIINEKEYQLLPSYPNAGNGNYDSDAPVVWVSGNQFVAKKIKKDIPKKDYEVIEYIGWHNLKKNTIFKKGGSELFYPKRVVNPIGYNEDYLKRQSTDIQIHSVKRLSDGLEFKIGDEVYVDLHGDAYNFVIGKFEIEAPTDLMVIPYRTMIRYNITLLKRNKPKKPLFTTEDLQPVFIHQKVWYVNGIWQIDTHDFDKQDDPFYPEIYKYFSTEQKAKQYVNENKPVLVSYIDYENYRQSVLEKERIVLFEDLIKGFFKSKIQL